MSASTLRKYTEQGIIECSRNLAGQRLYSPETIKNFLDKTNPPIASKKSAAFYISYSGSHQTSSNKQVESQDAHGEEIRVVQDEFSDVNASQTGLSTLLNLARGRGIECIALNPQDNSYLEHLLEDYNVKIIVLDNGAPPKEKPLYD